MHTSSSNLQNLSWSVHVFYVSFPVSDRGCGDQEQDLTPPRGWFQRKCACLLLEPKAQGLQSHLGAESQHGRRTVKMKVKEEVSRHFLVKFPDILTFIQKVLLNAEP